jgi:AraC-like DNA-binding protein
MTPTHFHEWDQLTYAASGVMRVHTDTASWVVPPHRAVWVPAGIRHHEEMHAPVSVRTLYLVPGIAKTLPRECRIVNISRLLRELILHVSHIGALDRRRRTHANLICVLLDELVSVAEVPLQLPTPRDPRALRFAAILGEHRTSGARCVALLLMRRREPADVMERLFLLAETKMTVGERRRRLRLLQDGVGLLATGELVTNVALDVGYASTSAFIAAFRKAFGVTPGPIFLTGQVSASNQRSVLSTSQVRAGGDDERGAIQAPAARATPTRVQPADQRPEQDRDANLAGLDARY